ncbi:MAG: DUF692 domain-containing protein [Blastocatellia bacterium]
MIATPHDLGTGIGWRPELALMIARRDGLRFVEVVAENIDPRAIPLPIRQLRERGVKVIPHGVSLSLGGAEPLDRDRAAKLGRLAVELDAPLVSEHAAFVRAGGVETGHLLPMPRTRDMLDVFAANVLAAKSVLQVPLALENIATLFEWPGAEMDEATFLAEALERTDTLLLLDVSNLYANSRNHGFDPVSYIDRLPLERLAYAHVAGGVERGGLYHDTHAHPIARGALDLLEELCARVTPPGVLLERDDGFPPDAELEAELDAIAASAERGSRRRGASRAS